MIWDENGNINPKISNLLVRIANDFYSKTELKAKIVDIVLLGSSAGYNYNNSSDIDVHVIIDFKELEMNTEDAKKYVDSLKASWNSKHKLHIKNKNIELYIQDVQDLLDTRAAGIFSLLRSQWLKKPSKDIPVVDKLKIKNDFDTIVKKINSLLSGNPTKDSIEKMLSDIYKLREKGLSTIGEYSTENLVFKLLRSKGIIDKLKDTSTTVYDKSVSIDENINNNDVTIKRETEGNRVIRFVAYIGNDKVGKIVLNKEWVLGYYTIIAYQVFNSSMKGLGIGRKLMNAVFNDTEIMKKPILVQPCPYDEKTKVEDLKKMYTHFGFRDWNEDKAFGYMIYDKHIGSTSNEKK